MIQSFLPFYFSYLKMLLSCLVWTFQETISCYLSYLHSLGYQFSFVSSFWFHLICLFFCLDFFANLLFSLYNLMDVWIFSFLFLFYDSFFFLSKFRIFYLFSNLYFFNSHFLLLQLYLDFVDNRLFSSFVYLIFWFLLSSKLSFLFSWFFYLTIGLL